MNSGIYSIRNSLTLRVYVGSSIDIFRRWKQHKSKLRLGKHSNRHLQRAWNKYGEVNFVFSPIEIALPEALTDREKFWIRELNSLSTGNGYNIADDIWHLGYIMPKEHREAISRGRTGIKFSEAHCRNIQKSKTGVKYSPRSDESKMRSAVAQHEWNKRVGLTPEKKAKISISVRKFQHENPTNKHGVTGLTFLNGQNLPWWVRLKENGKMKTVGRFNSKDEAAQAAQNFLAGRVK